MPKKVNYANSNLTNSHRPGSGIGAQSISIRRAKSISATNRPYGRLELEADRLADSVTTPDYSFAGSSFNAETGEVVILMTNTKFNSKADQPYDSVSVIELTYEQSEANLGNTAMEINGSTYYPKSGISGDVELMLPIHNQYDNSVTKTSNGVHTIQNAPALLQNDIVKFRVMGQFVHGSMYAVIQNSRNYSTGDYSYFPFQYTSPTSPRADFKVSGQYDEPSGEVSITISNVGTVKTTKNPYCYFNIFEVTTEESSSNTLQNLPAGTPLYTYMDKEIMQVYPLSMGNYGITDFATTSTSSTNINYTVVSSLTSSQNSYFRLTQELEPFDSVTITFKGSNFQTGSTYLFNADEILYWGTTQGGDTLEIIDDFANPTNNNYSFTAA